MIVLSKLVVWLVGAVVAYFLARRECRREAQGKWTQGDRLTWAALSLLGGPFLLVVAVVQWLVTQVHATPWAQREARW